MNSIKKHIYTNWWSFALSIILHIIVLSQFKKTNTNIENVNKNISSPKKSTFSLVFSSQGVSSKDLKVPKKVRMMNNQNPDNVLLNDSNEISDAQTQARQHEISNLSEKKYLSEFIKIIETQNKYPELARKRELEGIVYLSVIIKKSGEIINHKIVKESGVTLLDEAALKSIKKMVFYKAFPEELISESIEYHFPITYKLNF